MEYFRVIKLSTAMVAGVAAILWSGSVLAQTQARPLTPEELAQVIRRMQQDQKGKPELQPAPAPEFKSTSPQADRLPDGLFQRPDLYSADSGKDDRQGCARGC